MKLPKLDLALQKKTCKLKFLGRLWKVCRKEVNLEHSPAYQFGCCQWQTAHRPNRGYLIYRWVLFLLVLSIGIASFSCQRLPSIYAGKVEMNYFKWFIYYTNWGFIFIILQSALALAVTHRYWRQKTLNIAGEEDESPTPRHTPTPLLCRAYWLAHIIATDFAFVITLVYWTLVHDPRIHVVNALNLLVHGGNTVVVLVELGMTAHPLRFAHALYGVGAGLAYGIFSAFYWAVGGTDRIGLTAIYPTLDWDRPGKALGFVGLCAVVLVTAHTLATLLTMLRRRVAARLVPAFADRYTLPTH